MNWKTFDRNTLYMHVHRHIILSLLSVSRRRVIERAKPQQLQNYGKYTGRGAERRSPEVMLTDQGTKHKTQISSH
jgi:hypothetical protein